MKLVDRCSHPTIRSFSFLKNFGVRMVLCLGPEDYPEQSARFLHNNAITLICVAMYGNKAPFKTIPPEQIIQALKDISDIRNDPTDVHCDKGTHTTGTIIGCLRSSRSIAVSPARRRVD
jgi:tyrosine-protein phosphatase SIW14